MVKRLWLWAGIVVLIGALYAATAARPTPVLLDVPAMMAGQALSGRTLAERHEGSFYWSKCDRSAFSSVEMASLNPGDTPVIITGQFLDPIKGRSRAMHALGTSDSIAVVSRAQGVVVHSGGQFAEFRLFRSEPGADQYRGFYAITPAGLDAWNRDMLH